MEMGLLIAAAVLVAVIVAYYYTTRTKQMMETASDQANATVKNFSDKADTIAGNTDEVAKSVV